MFKTGTTTGIKGGHENLTMNVNKKHENIMARITHL
jgi:hypothetical protein